MESGMLWFDNDPTLDLLSKVRKAAVYYQAKYGESPNLCFVHPSLLEKDKEDSGTIVIHSSNTVLPNHYWIGVYQPEIPGNNPI